MKSKEFYGVESTSSSARIYLKAGAAFLATTAAYLLARTTGILPSWLQWGGDEQDQVIGANAEVVSTLGIVPWVSAQTAPVVNFADRPEIELAKLQPQAMSRHLLQTGGSVTVSNPIPDQVIEATEEFRYPLERVFSGNYTLLTATEMGKTILPSWLSLEYQQANYYNMAGDVTAITLSGNRLFVVNSNLQVFDVSVPAAPQLLGSCNLLAGGQDIVVIGNTAFIAIADRGLQIVNISNSFNPIFVSSYDTPGSAMGIAVTQNFVYVADGVAGLQIINIQNLTKPVYASNYTALGTTRSVSLEGQKIYLASSSNGLVILNISNPIIPVQIGYYSTPYARSVVALFPTVYLTDYDWGLVVFNVSNPAAPLWVSNCFLPAIPLSLSVSSPLAYIADSVAGLVVLNLSSETPVILGSTDTPGSANDVSAREPWVYIADNQGLATVDLRYGMLKGTPTSLRVAESVSIVVSVGSMNLSTASESFRLTIDQFPRRVDSSLLDQSIHPNNTQTLIFDSDALFTTLSQNNFLTLSIRVGSNQTIPHWMQWNLHPTLANTLTFGNVFTIKGSLSYFARQGFLQVIDIKDPYHPAVLGSISLPGNPRDIEVDGEILYLTDYSVGLSLFNISRSSQPYLVSVYPSSLLYDISFANDTLYLAHGYSGLLILNVSNSSAPAFLAAYDTPGEAFKVFVSDGYAYIADYTSGLTILNISNPSSPSFVANVFSGVIAALDVIVVDKLAYIAIYGDGLLTLNVSDAAHPMELGRYNTPGLAMSLVKSGNFVYIGDSASGLQIIDVSDPRSLRPVGQFDTIGDAGRIAISNYFAYTTDKDTQDVIDLSEWQLTATPSLTDAGNYEIFLTATTELGGTASDSFILRVEGPPRINSLIPFQYAKVGQAFNYFVPQGVLSDPNLDPISFTATVAGQSNLLPWLSFNGVSATFAGIPQEQHVGLFNISLSATDNIAGSTTTYFKLYVDHMPALNQPIANQVAGINLLYQFAVPNGTIVDADNDMLLYSAQQRSGSPLPSWLSFNNVTRTFSGVGNQTAAYTLLLLATDPYGGQARAEFSLSVENFPRVNQPIGSPVAGVGHPFSFIVPGNSFIDLDNEPLTYSARRRDGSSLPNWLSYNSQNLMFSGVPQATDRGVLFLQLIATDPSGGSAQQNFNLSVIDFPEVAAPINQPAPGREDRVFSFQVPNNTFSDLSGVPLTYNASRADGRELPAWLHFNTNTLVFSGMPSSSDVGTLSLLVVASDGKGGSARAPFDVVIESNFPPEVLTPISDQVAEVNSEFNVFVSPNTFRDRNQDPLSYQATQSRGQALPSWLHFDEKLLHFSGKPGRGDTDPFSDRVLKITLEARDDKSIVAANFNINVQGTSYYMLLVKILGPTFSGLGLLFGLYQKRAWLLNRCHKKQYQKLDQTIAIGEEFRYELQTPRAQIHRVLVKVPRENAKRCDSWRDCYRFFGSPSNYLRVSRQHLPGKMNLPEWMRYNPDNNSLVSIGPVPKVYYSELLVQVKDEADITREQFTLRVVGPEAAMDTMLTEAEDALPVEEKMASGGKSIEPITIHYSDGSARSMRSVNAKEAEVEMQVLRPELESVAQEESSNNQNAPAIGVSESAGSVESSRHSPSLFSQAKAANQSSMPNGEKFGLG